MNRILTLIICLVTLTSSAQITIMLYPVHGLELKPADVFKATVQSQDVTAAQYYFIGTVTNLVTGEKIVSARSVVVDVLPGATTLSESLLSPNYQITSPVVSQNGVFPYGNYRVCLAGYKVNAIEPVAEDCQDAEITPMSPPLLLSPENQSSITTETPLLVWLPPMPVMNAQVLYDLKIVEMQPNQTAYDAIQRNFGILEQQNITVTTLQYPMNAVKLEEGKKYAWKIVAKTQDGKPIGETEVWWFTFKTEKVSEDMSSIAINENYVIPKRDLDHDAINIGKKFKIYIEEYPQQLKLKFKIIDDKTQKEVEADKLSYTDDGNAHYTIALEEKFNLKSGGYYTLVVMLPNDNERYIYFRYINK
ncbi:MAG: hypothetical protein V4651_05145 [Bacteroidota bacterium]